MATHDLAATAQALVAPGRGILAADESTATIGKRFKGINVDNTEDTRRAYRELLLTAKGAGQYVSGAILYDETLRQKTASGVPFPAAMQKYRNARCHNLPWASDCVNECDDLCSLGLLRAAASSCFSCDDRKAAS